MTHSPASPGTPDLSGLIAAVARNTEPGGLHQFLDAYRWKVLADFVQPSSHPRGTLLIAQGDLDRKLYFIESGDLKVTMHTDKGIVHLAILGPGTVVGEGGFFSHKARNASVSAYSDCKVWTLAPTEFENLSRHHPSVALALSMALGAVLATRMLDMSKRLAIT
jgi:CRP-like cAMP-binding protein